MIPTRLVDCVTLAVRLSRDQIAQGVHAFAVCNCKDAELWNLRCVELAQTHVYDALGREGCRVNGTVPLNERLQV